MADQTDDFDPQRIHELIDSFRRTVAQQPLSIHQALERARQEIDAIQDCILQAEHTGLHSSGSAYPLDQAAHRAGILAAILEHAARSPRHKRNPKRTMPVNLRNAIINNPNSPRAARIYEG